MKLNENCRLRIVNHATFAGPIHPGWLLFLKKLVLIGLFSNDALNMGDQSIPRSKTFDCELAGIEVTFDWNEVTIMDGLNPRYTKMGTHKCSGVGIGGCPVIGKAGNRDWPKCPYLPKYH
jgi:hypothetical protein